MEQLAVTRFELPDHVIALVSMRNVVLFPARNEKDLREVLEAARATLKFIFLETVDDAIQASLGLRGSNCAGSEFKLV